jgi:heme/copper-type cytochrome/quinol oxidase subunit 3
MAEAATVPATTEEVVPAPPRTLGPPVSPGKVAIWIFLATEIMFFTGLIGTYIVLRAGSQTASYSREYPPNQTPGDYARANPEKVFSWPLPYDDATNPLSIDLTALNTFILICSSVSMVLALASIQRGQRARLCIWLLVTVLVGGTFLGIQVYEYRALMFNHIYPLGVSATGHFTPDVSLFASCFFTMTGFHGAHVAVGVLFISWLLLKSLLGRTPSTPPGFKTPFFIAALVRTIVGLALLGWGAYALYPTGRAYWNGNSTSLDLAGMAWPLAAVAVGLILAYPWHRLSAFTQASHSPVELVGLYWHFVDLVWIILFTVVYLI